MHEHELTLLIKLHLYFRIVRPMRCCCCFLLQILLLSLASHVSSSRMTRAERENVSLVRIQKKGKRFFGLAAQQHRRHGPLGKAGIAGYKRRLFYLARAHNRACDPDELAPAPSELDEELDFAPTDAPALLDGSASEHPNASDTLHIAHV